MKPPLLADALRGRDPGAPAELYDTHAENLFRYCWFILRNRDAAQLAVRDALVAAEAHIGELREPSMLRPWLYAFARAECLRRQRSPGAAHDAVVARPDQPDADRRLIAWHAVMSLAPGEREALELTIRQGMDAGPAALVMGMPATEIRSLLGAARVHLEYALAGEILARHGVHGCQERAEALRGWAGEMTVPLRERLVLHATSCQVCGRYLPRNVSAVKVYSLLPVPAPPPGMRLRVLTCLGDPELAGYRTFVAARVTRFDQLGFPDDSAAPAAAPRRVGARMWLGPAAAAVAVLVAAGFAISRFGGFSSAVHGVASSSGAPAGSVPPATGQRTGSGSVSSRRLGAGSSSGPSRPTAAVSSGDSRGPAALYLHGTPVPGQGPTVGPSQPAPGVSPPAGQLRVSPSELDLGTGSTGELTLSASGGVVAWSARTSSPDLTLSSSGGTVVPGQPVTVTVTVSRSPDASGQAAITFTPWGETVTISWASPVSNPPPPPPTASPSPTVITSAPTPAPPSTPGASPSPTPSPTASGSPPPAPGAG